MAKKSGRDPELLKSGQLTVRLDLEVRKEMVRQGNGLGIDEATFARMLLTDAVTASAKREQILLDAIDSGFAQMSEIMCAAIAASLPKEMSSGESPEEFKSRVIRSLNELLNIGKVVKQRIDTARQGRA